MKHLVVEQISAVRTESHGGCVSDVYGVHQHLWHEDFRIQYITSGFRYVNKFYSRVPGSQISCTRSGDILHYLIVSMSRVAMTHILRNPVRSTGYSTPESRLRRVALFVQPAKYDRQAETSLLRLDPALDFIPGPFIRPLNRSGYCSGWSIHDADSWNWTAGDVRWVLKFCLAEMNQFVF